MQTKRIKCPTCGVVLDVKNSKNEETKQITCPQCKSILQVKFAPQAEPIEAHTYYASPKPSPQSSNEDATQLGAAGYAATQLGASPKKENKTAKLLYGGESYDLEEGQNIVGRHGETSKATVQIKTADRYMSRQHCCIKVKTLPDGTKKAVLSNYQNKNMTTIDGQEIATGDEIRLTDGNRITMGHTTVTFKLS